MGEQLATMLKQLWNLTLTCLVMVALVLQTAVYPALAAEMLPRSPSPSPAKST
jgi:hypothetical protein